MHELLRLKRYLKRYWVHTIIGVVSLIIIDLLQLVVPRIIKRAIDGLASDTITPGGLGYYFLLIMLVAVGIAIGRFFWRYLIIGSSRRIERELRTDLYTHLLTLDFNFFDYHKTGDLMAHATNDINAVRMALGFGLVILTDIFILGIASLAMMINISPKLTLYAIIPFPLIAILSIRFGRIIHILFEKVQETFSLLTERVRENLSGIRVIKVFVQEEAEIKKFERLSNDYVGKNMKLIKLWGMFFPMVMFLAAIGQIIVLGIGGRFIILGEISIGSFVAFIAYLQILVWPMIAIGRAINIFQRGAASQGRLNKIFNEKPGLISGNKKLARPRGRIEFKGVNYYYKDNLILKDINLLIEPMKFMGITGPIGSGKTTLVNLLLRLYEPQSGEILIDGRNIKEFTIKSLRDNIAYVPQDTFLFSETIKENIVFGSGAARQEDIERVCHIAHIYNEIAQLPQGFETRIGERGVTLSGGQKQRIALARALLLDRPILILDDAVSSVDAETELQILSRLKHELEKKTAIIISHRVFALMDCHTIVVLDKGRIVEQGTHLELLKRKGLYREIYDIQQLELKLAGL